MLPFLKFHRKNRKKAPTKKAPRKKWEYCTDIKDDGKLNAFLHGLTDLKGSVIVRGRFISTARWKYSLFSSFPFGGLYVWGVLLVIPLKHHRKRHQPFSMTQPFKKAITRWEHCAEQYYRSCLSCFFYDFALPYYNKWIPIMKWVLIKYPIMDSSSEKNGEKVYILVYYKNKTIIYPDRAFPWSSKGAINKRSQP